LKLVVGLGNPGSDYAPTRHNVGYRVVERLARDLRIALDERRFGGRFGQGQATLVGGSKVDVGILAPETWMNRSGDAVAAALDGLPIENCAADLLIVFDDMDLPFGRLRVRPKGGAGGHNGLAHVLERLLERGIEKVPRLRFGIGRSQIPNSPDVPNPVIDWVLSPFSDEEEAGLDARLSDAALAVQVAFAEGVARAMNRFNRDPEAPEPGVGSTTDSDSP
jgi:PTH1 family peptidyl-tRNA hydrolase